jgi:hypothetical protein
MPIELTESERAELERRAVTVTLPFRTVQRARMILYPGSCGSARAPGVSGGAGTSD